MAAFYYSRGKLQEALAFAARAVKAEPENPVPAAALGVILTRAERFADALKIFEPWRTRSGAGFVRFHVERLAEALASKR